jgi:hypothetical protein
MTELAHNISTRHAAYRPDSDGDLHKGERCFFFSNISFKSLINVILPTRYVNTDDLLFSSLAGTTSYDIACQQDKHFKLHASDCECLDSESSIQSSSTPSSSGL